MGLLDRLFGGKKERSIQPLERGLEATSYSDFLYSGGFLNNDGIGGTSSWRLPAVYRCISIISETIATLPLNMILVKGNVKNKAEKHPNYRLFLSEPNKHQSWYDFMVFIVSQALTHGNGYALIERGKYGEVAAIHHLNNSECQAYYVRNAVDNSLVYYVFGKVKLPSEIIHIKCLSSDGVIGKSPIEIAREVVSGGLSQQTFTKSLYENGLNLQGTLATPAKLSENALEKLRKQFQAFRGSKNSHGTLILEEGLKYDKMGLSPIDAQFIESKKFTIEDIGRMYGVPLHKIGNLDRATNNNIEHQDLEFYKSCISAWEERIEQEFNRKLLVGKDRLMYKHEFDNSKLLRTDLTARSNWINAMFTKGAITPNEIRVIEGFNPIENEKLNETYMQLAMSTVDNLTTQNEADTKKL